MNKRNAKAWQNAVSFLNSGNPSAFARSVSAMHRADNAKQQKAIEAAIEAAGASHLFRRTNNALVAA